MARIRSIKPEITSDARLARLSRETRYHFVLLWTQCDDAGCFRATPRLLLGQLYPHDRDIGEAKVDAMTAELDEAGFVEVRQTPDGPVGKVRNWAKHQKIDRPSKSHLLPQFATASRDTRETPSHGVLSPESGVLSLDHTPSSAGEKKAAPPSEKGWQPVREQRIADRLPTAAGREALTALLHTQQGVVGKTAVCGEIETWLNGGGGQTCTVEQMDTALRDYVGKFLEQGWQPALFRACVGRVKRAGTANTPQPPPGEGDALDRWAADRKAREEATHA